MTTRLPALLQPPIGFGWPVDADEQDSDVDREPDALHGFQRALDLGASGLASQAWLTTDGAVALHRSGRIGSRLRRRHINRVTAAELPPNVARLHQLYDLVGPSTAISLDLQAADALQPIIDVARSVGPTAEDNLWLCHPDLATLTAWRPQTSARLINNDSYHRLDGGLERRASELEERDLDGLRLDHRDWTGGRVALLHRFGRLALGAGVTYEREAAAVIDRGIDAVYSTRVLEMSTTLNQYYPGTA